MGEWKAPLSLCVRQDLRREMEDFALTERRKLGNGGNLQSRPEFASLLAEFGGAKK